MKKIIYLFAFSILISCQKSFDELPTIPSSYADNTSAITPSISDFDPIRELDDIPVNIINYGNTNNKYLSANSSGNDVKLYNKDDGSLRQRWYISNTAINLMGGNSMTEDGETSSFSQAEGVSVSVTQSTSIGIPLVENGSFGYQVSTTQTASKDWTFGTSQSKKERFNSLSRYLFLPIQKPSSKLTCILTIPR